VPWFVAWKDGEPDFRLIEPAKFIEAIRSRKCWICGQPLQEVVTFVAVPMAGFMRVTPEPPAHAECASFSARACPHLALPQAQRREIEGATFPGNHDKSNQGMVMLWATKKYKPVQLDNGTYAVLMSEAIKVKWFVQARPASRDEVLAALEPIAVHMRRLAVVDNLTAQLEANIARLMKWVPAANVDKG
jgi:hypothetical protein